MDTVDISIEPTATTMVEMPFVTMDFLDLLSLKEFVHKLSLIDIYKLRQCCRAILSMDFSADIVQKPVPLYMKPPHHYTTHYEATVRKLARPGTLITARKYWPYFDWVTFYNNQPDTNRNKQLLTPYFVSYISTLDIWDFAYLIVEYWDLVRRWAESGALAHRIYSMLELFQDDTPQYMYKFMYGDIWLHSWRIFESQRTKSIKRAYVLRFAKRDTYYCGQDNKYELTVGQTYYCIEYDLPCLRETHRRFYTLEELLNSVCYACLAYGDVKGYYCRERNEFKRRKLVRA